MEYEVTVRINVKARNEEIALALVEKALQDAVKNDNSARVLNYNRLLDFRKDRID